MRWIICFAVIVVQVLPGVSAQAANSVRIESKTVAPGAADFPFGIYLVNEIPLQAVVVPLEVRSITPGAFITSMRLSFGGRLDSALTGGQYANQLGTKSLACKGNVPGFGDVLYTTINQEHPVAGSPEGALFARVKVQDRALAPGADLMPSMVLTADIGQTTGTFEIDTTCTTQNNHLYFIGDAPPGNPYVSVIPAFTKGIITIAACDCSHHGDLTGDDVFDVFDLSFLIDYVFSGTPVPPTDATCPHVDRGDANCDGVDDVLDVVYLTDYLFSSGPAPCNPCACTPYPANCP